jgi:hypothetical protein
MDSECSCVLTFLNMEVPERFGSSVSAIICIIDFDLLTWRNMLKS